MGADLLPPGERAGAPRQEGQDRSAESRKPGFELRLCPFAFWPQRSYLAFPSLPFILGKMAIMMFPPTNPHPVVFRFMQYCGKERQGTRGTTQHRPRAGEPLRKGLRADCGWGSHPV